MPVDFFSHTGALAHGILPKWGSVPESCGIMARQQERAGKRKKKTEWSRLLR
jgi:hypothetical protein